MLIQSECALPKIRNIVWCFFCWHTKIIFMLLGLMCTIRTPTYFHITLTGGHSKPQIHFSRQCEVYGSFGVLGRESTKSTTMMWTAESRAQWISCKICWVIWPTPKLPDSGLPNQERVTHTIILWYGKGNNGKKHHHFTWLRFSGFH